MKRQFAILILTAVSAAAALAQYNTGDVYQWLGGGKPRFAPYSSTYMIEGTNVFFTNARARSALSNSFPVAYDATTGIISLTGLSGAGASNRLIGMNNAGNALAYKTVVGVGGALVTFSGDSIYINAGVGGGGTGIQSVANGDGNLTITNPTGPTATINLVLDRFDSTFVKAGSIPGSDITNGTITRSDLAPGTKAFYADTADFALAAPPGGSAGGDLTGTYPNPTIGTGKVTTTHVLDGTLLTADAAASFKAPLAILADTAKAARPTSAATGDLTGTYPAPTIATNAVTSAKILDGTVARVDLISTLKAPYSDTADYARAAITSGAAGGDLTGTYPNPTIAASKVTTTSILNGTIQTIDASSTFKAPLSDTADYARAAPVAIGFIRFIDDSCDVSIPGMTTNGTAIFQVTDGRVNVPTSFNYAFYTNRLAIRSSTHFTVDSVRVKGIYIK